MLYLNKGLKTYGALLTRRSIASRGIVSYFLHSEAIADVTYV